VTPIFAVLLISHRSEARLTLTRANSQFQVEAGDVFVPDALTAVTVIVDGKLEDKAVSGTSAGLAEFAVPDLACPSEVVLDRVFRASILVAAWNRCYALCMRVLG
jgi:hypothetical protein